MQRRILRATAAAVLLAGGAVPARATDADFLESLRGGMSNILETHPMKTAPASPSKGVLVRLAGSGASPYAFEAKARLYSLTRMMVQEAVLSGSFEIPDQASGPDIPIGRIRLELKLLASGGRPAYALTIPAPAGEPDFFPPDPSWSGAAGQSGVEAQTIAFSFEAKTAVSAAASGTVMESALHEAAGRLYGAKALLRLNFSCSKELSSCAVGMAGIAYDHWGTGWSSRLEPELLLVSEASFPIKPISPQGAGAGYGQPEIIRVLKDEWQCKVAQQCHYWRFASQCSSTAKPYGCWQKSKMECVERASGRETTFETDAFMGCMAGAIECNDYPVEGVCR